MPLPQLSVKKNFASDNHSGVHPEFLKAIESVNSGYCHSYGGDDVTVHAIQQFKKHFGEETDVHFVFNGTAANVTALKMLVRPHEAVICAETAHLNMDECGAPEHIGGFKLLTIPTTDGKITISDIEKKYVRLGDQHCSQPRAVSITQPTEYGTCYTQLEIKEIADWCHKRKMYLHVDGARFSNAVYTLKTTFKALSRDCGVDVLSFGGTKNGLLFGEAVLFFDPELSKDFKFIRKQSMQLPSKMRFLSAQFAVYFENEIWLQNARNSCEMALYLRDQLLKIPEIKITQNVQSNAVFAILPRHILKNLREKFFFYIWDETTFEARLMCGFDMARADVDAFVSEILKELSNK